MMGFINVSKSGILLALASFVWIDSGSAQSEYPNPFAPDPSTPPEASAPAAGPPTGEMADYPNLFAPGSGEMGGYPNPSDPARERCSALAECCPELANANVAVCPTSNNRVYYTLDGTFFKIQCGHHKGTTAIQVTTAPTLQECIDKCSQENGCNSVNYVPASLECSLLPSTGAATILETTASQDYAYKIDPPTQPAKDEHLVACSTTCPSANGQGYSSIFGETFRINCGKRHGTAPLKTDKQATFKDCMDSCASYIPCHSVDYHDRSQTCYYSNHHGEPTIVTSGFSSAYSLGCASSCCGNTASSCQGSNGGTSCIPPKPLDPPKPDLSCGNQGLQYAIYGNSQQDWQPTFDPAKVKTARLQYSGTTHSIGLAKSTPIYGNAPRDPRFTTVNHRAYIFAQQSGTYTFRLPLVDDITLLWVGAAAYSGFTRANSNIAQTYVSGTQKALTYTVTFEKGKYYPIRVIWANGGGPGYFSFELKGPDGKVIIGAETTEPSPFLVQYSCDGTTAPRFPPFGSET